MTEETTKKPKIFRFHLIAQDRATMGIVVFAADKRKEVNDYLAENRTLEAKAIVKGRNIPFAEARSLNF